MARSEKERITPSKRLKILSLSRLYSLIKKTRGISDPLEPDCEHLHAPSQDYNWNESFYFNFTDPKRAIGGWTRLGILPNQDSDLGAMMLYVGGNRILATLQTGKAAAEDESFSLGDLTYRREIPLMKWRLAYRGDMMDVEDSRRLPELNPETLKLQQVEVDLLFEGLAPCFNFKDAHPRALAEMVVNAGTRLKDLRQVSKVSSEHYEQAGKVTGMIKIGNREISFAGSGHRDHSWGLRDWAAPRLWTWLTSQFGDELSFNLSRVAIASVDIFNGFVTRDGNNYPVRRADLETEFEGDGVTQKSLRFSIEDAGGKTIEVSGEVLTVIPLVLASGDRRTLVNEALTEYRFGDGVGYGISEYLHQLED
ncbi:MAG: hypothetical protein SWK76_11465 [Actinomycetota bacterium]|nr:hypothetical protein [Actinomycetota bacterium]